MRIHHLSCGTFCPPSATLVNGRGGLLATAHLTCTCLAIETNDGLVLVDTGLGIADLVDPPGRIGPTWSRLMRPQPDPDLSMVRQLADLGFYPDDVRHIVVTHLDFDHAGGIPDFPEAKIQVYEPEYQAAMNPRTALERFRYKPEHFAHTPEWVRYNETGDRWFGFEGVHALNDDDVEILLVPLVGHTRGHCGVAVRDGHGWLLHAGDAYFGRTEITGADRSAPPVLKGYERMMQASKEKRVANQFRLRELMQDHGDQVRILCSHDPDEFNAAHRGDLSFLPNPRSREHRRL